MAREADVGTRLMPDAEQPLVLVGPPRDLRGQFRVENPTDRKIVVRRPLLRASGTARTTGTARRSKGAAQKPVPAPPDLTLALRRIIVRAGQSRPVPIALALDARTPPGTYEAELDVHGQTRQVIMHVVEDVGLSIAPAHLVLPNRPGGKIDKRIVVTNEGNIPLAVHTIGVIVLDEELAHCRALRGALADVGDTMKTLDDFAAALGRRYRAVYETLVLRVQNDAVTIEPGDTHAIDLRITLPEKLDARARYTGYAAIATANLTFTIVPE